jgi:hypothetical protein
LSSEGRIPGCVLINESVFSSLFISGWFLSTAGQFPTRSNAQRRVGSALSDFDEKERASLRAIAQLALNGRHPSASSTELRACMNLVLSLSRS